MYFSKLGAVNRIKPRLIHKGLRSNGYSWHIQPRYKFFFLPTLYLELPVLREFFCFAAYRYCSHFLSLKLNSLDNPSSSPPLFLAQHCFFYSFISCPQPPPLLKNKQNQNNHCKSCIKLFMLDLPDLNFEKITILEFTSAMHNVNTQTAG